MSFPPSNRARVAAVVLAAAVAISLTASSSPVAAAKPQRATSAKASQVTVELVCPPGNYQKVANIALFDRKGAVVGAVGALECGAGVLSTYPGPASHPERRTVQVTATPTRVGYQGEWTCADSSRPDGDSLGGPVYIAFSPNYFSLSRTSPTTIPCQALDTNGQGYSSSLRVSW